MPHFHFHTADGRRVFDQDGYDLPDLARVRTDAIRPAGAMLRERPDHLRESGT